MQLTLIKKEEIFSLMLPHKVEGNYWVTHLGKDKKNEKVISVEGIEGHWILRSNKSVYLIDEHNRKVRQTTIKEKGFYPIVFCKTGEKAMLFAEKNTEDRSTYTKLIVPYEASISIGRSEDNEICFDNQYTSSKHARLICKDCTYELEDLESVNGTYVNGKGIKRTSLNYGDTIYIMGLKIIIARDHIAVNNPDGSMSWDKHTFKNYKPQTIAPMNEEEEEIQFSEELFFRSPRFKRDIVPCELKLDAPPLMEQPGKLPTVLTLGPSMTMGLASLSTGGLAVANALVGTGGIKSALPRIILCGSMFLGSVLWPLTIKAYEKKQSARKERYRQIKYRSYLEEKAGEIQAVKEAQEQILRENIVDLDDCIARIENKTPNLWDHTGNHNDFLMLRLGLGKLPVQMQIKYPEKRFTLEEDVLLKELYDLVEQPRALDNVPITLSLIKEPICGIVGENRSQVIQYLKAMMLQIASLHSYDEVKFVMVYSEREATEMAFAKWLPHCFDNEKQHRFIAIEQSDLKNVSRYMEEVLTKREEAKLGNHHLPMPYYVVIVLDKELERKAEFIQERLKKEEQLGMGIIFAYDQIKDLPKECGSVVELQGEEAKLYNKNDISGETLCFKTEQYQIENMRKLAGQLANTHLDTLESAYTLPNMLTFLELFGADKVEHLNALARWQQNDPTHSLEAPIGVNQMGEIFGLDLHEKYHGAHGLIAGTTGSGKSEFIMTYILSLAVNFHPHEVSFILIDYKGGGMAKAFEKLPHTAGIITNLDGSAINRSLASIQSELNKRQSLFNEASKKLGVSNIDIYKYQQYYREGLVSEPLSHLFIISDEFAELKMQRPEFMARLISAARIGRSLGIHLILATQKPSGVVDDQIWSNSKFKVCLKVQDRSDSMEVIKRPDAAELSTTGRFYLQVGYNEIFELGQSAWAGAPYFEKESVGGRKEQFIELINHTGQVIRKTILNKRQSMYKNPPKQLDQITAYLSELAKREKIKARTLWEEEMPAVILRGELIDKYGVREQKGHINPVIGELDDPNHQRKELLTLSLTEGSNTIIYGMPGSGKTMLLSTLLYSLISQYTPKELNTYVLDFEAETLRAFKEAPHVGEVLGSQDEEKIINLFKWLNEEVEIRKKIFMAYGGSFVSYTHAGGDQYPAQVIIIHNYAVFADLFSAQSDIVQYLTREGSKYGIYFILTTMTANTIKYRIVQNFAQQLVLQLNDSSDYSSLLGNTQGLFPSKYEGRGLIKSDAIYEFQTASIYQGKDAVMNLEAICNWSKQCAINWQGESARKIDILPKHFNMTYMQENDMEWDTNKLPIGINKETLKPVYYNFESQSIQYILSEDTDQVDFLQGVSEFLQTKAKVTIVDPTSSLQENEAFNVNCIHVEIEAYVNELFKEVVKRHNTTKAAKDSGELVPVFEKQFVMFNNLQEVFKVLSEDAKDKLKLILDKNQTVFNLFVIINDACKSLAAVKFDNWFKDHVDLQTLIWTGDGLNTQYVINIKNKNAMMRTSMGEKFGYCIEKGNGTFIKLLESQCQGEDEYE